MAALRRTVFNFRNIIRNTARLQHGSGLYKFQLTPQYQRNINSQMLVAETISKHRKWRILCGGIASCSVGLTLFTISKKGLLKETHLKVPVVEAANPEGPSKRQSLNFIADVVDKIAPAVVHIERIHHAVDAFTGKNFSLPESQGSGFIVRKDGLILTNAHVVGNKSTVKVKLQDGRSFNGVIQAVDRISDLATVKINATDLPILKLGKSSEMRPGEWVIAMGSPLTLSNTVTHGIVSTTQRRSGELGIHGKSIDYIQTDAAIDVGNSGGPLVNLDGEAIGINTLKVTAGISFAIPSDYAQQFLDKANTIEKRSASKGWFTSGKPAPTNVQPDRSSRYMGIRMLTLTPEILMELKSRVIEEIPDVSHGVMVVGVIHGSPAYSGGLKPGDVITKINNTSVSSASDVYKAVDTYPEMTLQIHRGRQTMVLKIKPEDAES